MYEKLFEKGRIGNVELKNRLVMTPMGTNLAELDGTVGPAMLAYFEARAKGGCGLIMPEICKVNEKTGVGMFRQIISRHWHASRQLYISTEARSLSSFIIPAVRVFLP